MTQSRLDSLLENAKNNETTLSEVTEIEFYSITRSN